MSLNLSFTQNRPSSFGNVILQKTIPTNLDRKSDILEEALQRLKEQSHIKSNRDRVQARMCLDEALVNAMEHGNNGDPEKDVFLEIFSDSEKKRWGARVEDEGPGFDEEDLSDPTDAEGKLDVSGRGVLLIKNFMDELTFYDNGSGVFMAKNVSSKQDK